MPQRKPLTVLAVAVTLSLATAAAALDHWPADPDGLVYTFTSPDLGEMTLAFAADGSLHELQYAWASCYGQLAFDVSDAAASLASGITMCDGWVDPDWMELAPPLDIVRAGMDDGDTWVHAHGETLIVVTVTREAITVPLGDFDTLHVALQVIMGPFVAFTDWWFEPALGPVKLDGWDLAAIEGTVAAAPRTWSAVKALYD